MKNVKVWNVLLIAVLLNRPPNKPIPLFKDNIFKLNKDNIKPLNKIKTNVRL